MKNFKKNIAKEFIILICITLITGIFYFGILTSNYIVNNKINKSTEKIHHLHEQLTFINNQILDFGINKEIREKFEGVNIYSITSELDSANLLKLFSENQTLFLNKCNNSSIDTFLIANKYFIYRRDKKVYLRIDTSNISRIVQVFFKNPENYKIYRSAMGNVLMTKVDDDFYRLYANKEIIGVFNLISMGIENQASYDRIKSKNKLYNSKNTIILENYIKEKNNLIKYKINIVNKESKRNIIFWFIVIISSLAYPIRFTIIMLKWSIKKI